MLYSINTQNLCTSIHVSIFKVIVMDVGSPGSQQPLVGKEGPGPLIKVTKGRRTTQAVSFGMRSCFWAKLPRPNEVGFKLPDPSVISSIQRLSAEFPVDVTSEWVEIKALARPVTSIQRTTCEGVIFGQISGKSSPGVCQLCALSLKTALVMKRTQGERSKQVLGQDG